MEESLILTGWRHSIYTAIARLVLAEKGVSAQFRDIDPFRVPKPPGLSRFGLVPVLRRGGFTLYETVAICRWIDEGFPGPALQPVTPEARARMVQVIAIADAHAYRPLVREVYGAGVFALAEGQMRDAARVARGQESAAPVLAALEEIAAEGRVLAPDRLTLADLHLGPMILAFTRAPEGRAALAGFPALSDWWRRVSCRPALRICLPPLPADGI